MSHVLLNHEKFETVSKRQSTRKKILYEKKILFKICGKINRDVVWRLYKEICNILKNLL